MNFKDIVNRLELAKLFEFICINYSKEVIKCMKYKIADIVVEFNASFNMLKVRANKYLAGNAENTKFIMCVYDEHIQKIKDNNPKITSELAEYMAMGTTFYRELLNYKGCLLHSSAVVIDNECYLFSANCGVGKSTHTSLWLKFLADKKPYILNDDKPAIRIMEDGIYAYGTPFSGKHDINENKRVKLKAICFIEQSKTNSIRKLEPKEAINLFYGQTLNELNEDEVMKFLDILEIIVKKIPIYKLYCNMSEEAVRLSYNTLKGEDSSEN